MASLLSDEGLSEYSWSLRRSNGRRHFGEHYLEQALRQAGYEFTTTVGGHGAPVSRITGKSDESGSRYRLLQNLSWHRARAALRKDNYEIEFVDDSGYSVVEGTPALVDRIVAMGPMAIEIANTLIPELSTDDDGADLTDEELLTMIEAMSQ